MLSDFNYIVFFKKIGTQLNNDGFYWPHQTYIYLCFLGVILILFFILGHAS